LYCTTKNKVIYNIFDSQTITLITNYYYNLLDLGDGLRSLN
jgi:hypothetical protein